MKFVTKSNEKGYTYSIEAVKNSGDQFMFNDIVEDLDLTWE